MMNNIRLCYYYSGHSECLSKFDTVEQGENEFNSVLSHWNLEPHDQSLELVDAEGNTLIEHIFNNGKWESDE